MHLAFTLGPSEIGIIMLVALLVFGAEKLPEIGRQIGMAYRELNRLRGDVQRAFDLDEYTRLDTPSYHAPSGSTYSYEIPALERQTEEEETDPTANEENSPNEKGDDAYDVAVAPQGETTSAAEAPEAHPTVAPAPPMPHDKEL